MLWPDDGVVGWLFFNLFQNQEVDSVKEGGDCPKMLDELYSQFEDEDSDNHHDEWNDIPWGLGAWGTLWAKYNVTKPISEESRTACLDGMIDDLESGDYPRIKAAIYFNSSWCKIDENQTPEMLDVFKDYLDSDAFYQEDLIL